MGKIACECGFIHSDTCGYDGSLFRGDDWIHEEGEPINVFECPQCGNIMIDDPTDEKMMITYRPENGKYNKILHDLTPDGDYNDEKKG
jgi:Zn-finger nucleic acid-binding protein